MFYIRTFFSSTELGFAFSVNSGILTLVERYVAVDNDYYIFFPSEVFDCSAAQWRPNKDIGAEIGDIVEVVVYQQGLLDYRGTFSVVALPRFSKSQFIALTTEVGYGHYRCHDNTTYVLS